MYIYLDESGSFAHTAIGHSVSCIAALVVSDRSHAPLIAAFDRLASSWGFPHSEVKGRSLDEAQHATVIELLREFNVFVSIVAVDAALHSPSSIIEHKRNQADRIVAASLDLNPQLAAQLTQTATRLGALSNPLYVQFVLLTRLYSSVIQTSTLFFSVVEPPTLATFAWRLDAKANMETKYEQLWKLLVMPFLQSISLKDSFIFLHEGDYSAFSRFENPDLPEPPDHLKGHVSGGGAPFSSFRINEIMRDDLQFLDSRAERGLQIADVLANCFQRACNGRLESAGWAAMGNLMIADPRGRPAIQFCGLEKGLADSARIRLPYANVVHSMERHARPLSHFFRRASATPES